MHFYLPFLRWSQLDPATHPYQEEELRPRLMPLLERGLAALREAPAPAASDPGLAMVARAVGEPAELRRELQEELSLAVVEVLGNWAAGWTWSRVDGGPVSGWCCSVDCVLLDGEDCGPTFARLLEGVRSWRAYLEELAATQRALREETKGLSVEEELERAALRYLPLVLARTDAEDAWYRTFELALRWHLESLGLEDTEVGARLGALVHGPFQSWCAPEETTQRSLARALGVELAALSRRPSSDALAAWREVRRSTAWERLPPSALRPVPRDGHLEHLELADRARSAQRAEGMATALAFVRARAREPLTWELLAQAQNLVLGSPRAEFRRSDAFAKDGRERYGLGPSTREEFLECLAQSEREDLPPLTRAARLYLDVCFFHPFEDGNGRAARLALDHLLTRHGLALRGCAVLFTLAWPARAPNTGWLFASLLGRLAGPWERA